MKKILIVIASLIILILSSVPVLAYTSYPDWFPDDVNSFQDYHNENAPRVVDNGNFLSDSEEADLTARIEKLIAKHDKDFVIYTDTQDYGMDLLTLAADFYQFNGYGKGEDYSGSVFFLMSYMGHGGWRSVARGKSREFFTEDNINALDDAIESDIKDGNYYDAMVTYVESLDGLYTKGRVPRPFKYFLYGGIGAGIVGLILMFIVTGALKKNMKKVATAAGASTYAVPNSFNLVNSNDIFLYMHMTRVRRNNNGGGKSFFSGGFTSSGGGSFSGGGRNF